VDSDGSAAVWVWFTERAGSKRQVHYRNDARLAAFVGGDYRPIAYQISGEDGGPRSVHVRFDDIENTPVEIEVRCDPDQTLTRHGAGLTDQSGHMSDRAFLVFHRETNALAREGRALVSFATIHSRPPSAPADLHPPPRPRACMPCTGPGEAASRCCLIRPGN
jgi:hypothetical protein